MAWVHRKSQILKADEVDTSLMEEFLYLCIHQGFQLLIRKISASADPIKGLIAISGVAHDLRSPFLQI
jgi:hypothetical protein